MGGPSPSASGRYALVAACSCLIGWLLASWLSAPAPVPGPTDTGSPIDLESVHLRLDTMERQLDALLADRTQPVGSIERRAVSEDSEIDLFAEKLEAIQRRLEYLISALWSGGSASAPLPRSPGNWAALEELNSLHERDQKAAIRSTMLLAPAEVVARFGFPTEVGGANGGGVFWSYNRVGSDGEPSGEVMFVFRDGHVAWHEIRLPSR